MNGTIHELEAERPVNASYVFYVRFRLDPVASDVSLETQTFEARVRLAAVEPGQEGWMRFRDLLWRGEVNDEAYARELLERKLGVPVEAVSFRALETDEAYLEALLDEIAADLDPFNATNATAVRSKYLGSSVIVTSDDG